MLQLVKRNQKLSTLFTRTAAKTSPPAPLTVLLQTASQWVMTGLLNALHLQGYADITEPHLILIGNLDCGTTHAAAVAQRMGVSRQAINRTLRELETQGFLRLEEDPVRRNQKIIVITESGVELVTHARRALDELEELLGSRIGRNDRQ